MASNWKAVVSTKLAGISPDDAWSLLGDFLALDKLLPTIATCRKVDGTDDVGPGCVRYCASSLDGSDSGPLFWAKERLLSMDPVQRSYSYEIVESNMGFGKYVGTLKGVPGVEGGSVVEWSFEAEPVEGWTRSDLVDYMKVGVEEMGKRVGDGLRANGKK